MSEKQVGHVPITREHVMNAGNKELKLLCREHSLPVSGNKKKLQKRLLQYLEDAETRPEEDMETQPEEDAETQPEEDAETQPEEDMEGDLEVPTSKEVMVMDRDALMTICNTLDIDVDDTDTDDVRQMILDIITEAEGEMEGPGETGEGTGETGEGTGETGEGTGETGEGTGETREGTGETGGEGPLPEIPDVMDPKESLEEANYVRDVLGRAEDSIALYESLFVFVRNKDKKLSSRVMVQKGVAHQFISELDKAVVCYTEAIRISPRNSEARMLLDGARAISAQTRPGTHTATSGHEDLPLAEKHERLKGLLARMDEPVGSSHVTSRDTGIARSGPVEIALRTGPTSEADIKPSNREKEGPGKGSDERTLKEQDRIAQRLARLRERIDIGSEGKRGGAGISVNPTKNASEAPEVRRPTDINEMLKDIKVTREKDQDRPTPPDTGRGASKRKGKKDENTERSEAHTETPTPGEPPDTPSPARVGTGQTGGTLTSGSEELDALIGGGLSRGSQLLVDAPPDIGKESVLYNFANSCVKGSIPMIVITSTDPPVSVRSQMSMSCRGLAEAENAGKVFWIDRRSEEALSRYTLDPSDIRAHSDLEEGILELPDNYTSILKAVMEFASREKGGPFCLLVMSLTPLVTYQEPLLIERFVGSLSTLVKEYGGYGIHSIENDMHNEKEIALMRKHMDLVIELKSNTDLADREHPALIRSAGHGKMKETRWTGYVVNGDGGYRIGW